MTGETIQPPTPGAATPDTSSGAIAAAQNLALQNAPWSKGVSWVMILGQGIVLVVVGLLLALVTNVTAHTVLQILGLVLLARAVVVIYRLVRGQVAPARLVLSSFEAGVNATTGLLVLFGTLFVPNTPEATTALAAVLGIGFILFGGVAILAAWLGGQPGERLPYGRMILGAVGVVVGVLLAFNATRGFDSVRTAFALLGWLMLLAGIGLIGYSLMLRSSQTQESDA
jgi:hypothetical protein